MEEMLSKELEQARNCSIGVKTSSKGHRQYWRGYKLHLDVADGQIPISAVLTGGERARFSGCDTAGDDEFLARSVLCWL